MKHVVQKHRNQHDSQVSDMHCLHHIIDLCTKAVCKCVCFLQLLTIYPALHCSVSDCIFRSISGVAVSIFSLAERKGEQADLFP